MNKRKRMIWIAVFTVVIFMSVILLYFGLQMPSFSPEMAMHRKEEPMLIGPSRIIASDTVEYTLYERSFLLGETDDGYCLYEYRDRLEFWDAGDLTYIAKDDKRVCFIPDRYTDVEFRKILPVFAVAENSAAVSARLTLETVSDKDPAYCGTVTAQAQLRQGCYFLFETDLSEVQIDVARYWNLRLKGNQWPHGYIMGTVTLELFDRDGNLIETRVTEFSANP